MAEISNNSNDNGGSDDAILAMLEGNITKATLKAACYAFSDKIKAEKKAIYGRRFRALGRGGKFSKTRHLGVLFERPGLKG